MFFSINLKYLTLFRKGYLLNFQERRIDRQMEEYLQHFSNIYQNQTFKFKYPRISEEMENICTEFKSCVHEIKYDNILSSISRLHGYDSKLQIIIGLINEVHESISEEELLIMVQNDYKNLYKELMGYRLNENVPLSLLSFIC